MVPNYIIDEFRELCTELRIVSRQIKKVQRLAVDDKNKKNILGLTEPDLIVLDQAMHVLQSESYALNALRRDIEIREN